MKCPKCHNENKYDNLTCDFCMAELPMTKEREIEIKKIKKLEKKAKFEKTKNVLIGMGIALGCIIILIIVMIIVRG